MRRPDTTGPNSIARDKPRRWALDNEFIEITPEDASRIVNRIRKPRKTPR